MRQPLFGLLSVRPFFKSTFRLAAVSLALTVTAAATQAQTQTGSILPCMLFHMLHNTLTLATSQIKPELLTQWPVLARIVAPNQEFGCVFHWPTVVVSGVATLLLLAFFARLPSCRSAEEELQEAIDMGLRSAEG